MLSGTPVLNSGPQDTGESLDKKKKKQTLQEKSIL
jgi:hypothetical protein